jgi:hypothetical protein
MAPENLDTSVSPVGGPTFSPSVVERLGWYIYALRDPRDQRVFYVGTGMGNRVFQHARAERPEAGTAVITQIRKIITAGYQVEAFIIQRGIANEGLARQVEAGITTYRLLDPGLANDRLLMTNMGPKRADAPANADVFACLDPTLPSAGWRRKAGVLPGMEPLGDGWWTQHVPLLWALRPCPEDPSGWLPPDPRNMDGSGHAPWWTPLLHLVRFQMGLRRPGEHLAWLRSDPEAAAAHSPLVAAQFALMDKWWGSEAVEDFIAWAVHPVVSPHLHWWPGGGELPTDEGVPRLSERQTSFYERRRESARWKSTWGGGYDPMHLNLHAKVPFTTDPEQDWSLGHHWPDRNPLLRWLREEHSAGLRLVSTNYAGWYGELLARGRTLREQALVQVTIEDFGPLGTFAIGGGRQPRMFAYPDAQHDDASAGGQGKFTFVLSETNDEPVVGDVGLVAMLSPVVDGEIRIWTDQGHALWKVREPEELAAAMGKGGVARTGVEPNRFREVGMLMKSGTLLLPARMKRGQKPIEARSFGLSRAPRRADSQGQWNEFARWLGTAALSAARRGEFLVVENGGWDHQPHPYAMFMCIKRDEVWVSNLEVSPAPNRSTLLWPSPPADPAGATATAPATEPAVAAAGRALASAISEWASSPLDLAVTYGPNPDGPVILTPTGSVTPT